MSAHAMNNSGPVAKILERDGWKSRMDFVGHRKAITCVVCVTVKFFLALFTGIFFVCFFGGLPVVCRLMGLRETEC